MYMAIGVVGGWAVGVVNAWGNVVPINNAIFNEFEEADNKAKEVAKQNKGKYINNR